MTKLAIVVGGQVRSRNDGDLHWISSFTLCHLYGLPQDRAIHINEKSHHAANEAIRQYQHGFPRLPVLTVRPDGEYFLPQSLKDQLNNHPGC